MLLNLTDHVLKGDFCTEFDKQISGTQYLMGDVHINAGVKDRVKEAEFIRASAAIGTVQAD